MESSCYKICILQLGFKRLIYIYITIISIHDITSYSSIVMITVRNGNHETLEGLQNK